MVKMVKVRRFKILEYLLNHFLSNSEMIRPNYHVGLCVN